MLPTHGAVTSVFLLANAVRYGGQPDVVSWVRAAQEKSAFLAAAIDHEPIARFLISQGLVSSHQGIAPGTRLKAVSTRADRHTLVAIAALLLEVAPPPWLPIAIVDRHIRYELIPSDDLDAMAWLAADLEGLLLDAVPPTPPDDDILALGIGRAAELAVLAALTADGGSAVQVSSISNRFGYDIESFHDTRIRRWEVKGCTPATVGSFHLSRNEFEKSRVFGPDWTLVQVQFTGAALTADPITAEHISSARELSSAALLGFAPPDTAHFRWESSARVTPAPNAWIASDLVVPTLLRLPGIYELGLEARELHDTYLSRQSAARPAAGGGVT